MTHNAPQQVQVFDLTVPSQAREYQDLTNLPGVAILDEKDCFAVGRGEEGPVPFVLRVVDYRRETTASEPLYTPPIC